MMQLRSLHIQSPFKNLDTTQLFDFSEQEGISVVIGNNGCGKSNLLEAISSVFAGLYSKKHKPEFDYTLQYKIDEKEVQVICQGKDFQYTVDGVSRKSISKNLLPDMVISVYSGEELRMWNKYYYDFYDTYIKNIITSKKEVAEDLKMLFVNKYHWNIALLTMLASDLDVKDILGEAEVSKIEIEFNEKNVTAFNKKNPNKVTVFAQALQEYSGTLTIETFQDTVLDTHQMLFKKLMVAHLPKEESYRLIDTLTLYFADGTSTQDFSEGEKKRILIKFITRILATPNSLLLLDEPDSHIHVAKKETLKSLLYDEDSQPHVNSILTTHSPTLTQCFDNNHVVMLDQGKMIEKEKRDIIEELTHEFWSKQEQNIFLSSTNDILLVEGKTDMLFIQAAIEKLEEGKYEALNDLEYIPTGGASGLRLFIDKFQAKEGQKIIAILDGDKAGCDEIKEVLSEDDRKGLSTNGHIKVTSLESTFLLMLPKLDRITDSQYEIEDYFPTEKLHQIAKNQIDTFKVIKNFSLKKDFIKKHLKTNVSNYNKEDFSDFKVLLDKLLEIKDL